MKDLNEQEIIRMYTEDKIPQTKIAKIFSVDSRRIRKILTDNHIEIINPKKGRIYIDPDIQEKVIELYKNGETYKQITTQLSIGEKSIRKILERNNIFRRRPSETSRKYEADYSFFESIDSEIKAYWLGFLYADGYVTLGGENTSPHVSLSLNSVDKEHIELFKRNIRAQNPLEKKKYKTTTGKSEESTGITIRHPKIAQDLISKGCLNNKSLILKFPNIEQVPLHLVRHFIRGYFDGDGCLSKLENGKFSFQMCGTFEFLSSVLDFFGLSYKLQQGKDKNKNNYSFCIKGNKQIESLLNILYKDSKIFLKRKAILFLDLKLTNTFNHA